VVKASRLAARLATLGVTAPAEVRVAALSAVLSEVPAELALFLTCVRAPDRTPMYANGTLAGDDGFFLAQDALPDALAGDSVEAEALRVARGLPRFHVDYTEAHYPQEALLEKTHVAFDKGCYVGQEVVCMLELRGHVKRKLVLVAFTGEAPPGAQLTTAEGVAVGELAGVAAHALEEGKNLGFAMVKVAAAGPGTALRVGSSDAPVDAVVVAPALAGGAS